MKRALALVLVASLSAFGAEPADAPVVMQAGDPAPVGGVLLPNELAVTRAKELASLRVEVAELRAKPEGVSVPVVALLVIAGVVVGGAAGAGVVLATKTPVP